MNITLTHPNYAENVKAPASKSAVHRALIAAAFADKSTAFFLEEPGEDLLATAACLAVLGAKFQKTERGFLLFPIEKNALPRKVVLDCNESGSTLRFLLPIVAALGIEADFLRRGRLAQRPILPLLEELSRHGLSFEEKGEILHISGRIFAGDYRVEAGVSSQFTTGLLFGLSLCETTSRLLPLGETVSAGYVAMTLQTLQRFGAPVAHEDGYYRINGKGVNPFVTPGEILPEGDFSGAAFPLAMGALGWHPVTVTGLPAQTAQADAAILDFLKKFGAQLAESAEGITVFPSNLHAVTAVLQDCPDLLPILTVLALAAKGQSRFTHVGRLRYKESDRLNALAALANSLGGRAEIKEDEFLVFGGALHGGRVESFGDHRIAMSAALASIFIKEPITVCSADCVKKSYPDFWRRVFSLFGKENV